MAPLLLCCGKSNEVERLLAAHRLAQYASPLAELGFDDAQQLLSMTEAERHALAVRLQMPLGHTERFERMRGRHRPVSRMIGAPAPSLEDLRSLSLVDFARLLLNTPRAKLSLQAMPEAPNGVRSSLLLPGTPRSAGPGGPRFSQVELPGEQQNLAGMRQEVVVGAAGRRTSMDEDGCRFDVFVSHAKRLEASEDRAVWIADLIENSGLLAFFDRSDLDEISEEALKERMMSSRVVVTILDPYTFNSSWVLRENEWAANAGIPIITVYDADRFKWAGQLDKWFQLYPWAFARQSVPLTKLHRRNTLQMLLAAVRSGLDVAALGRKPPAQSVQASVESLSSAKIGAGGSRATETELAVEAAYEAMMTKLGGAKPTLVLAAFTDTHDAELVGNELDSLLGDVPMLGCTSCRGVVLNDSWLTYDKRSPAAPPPLPCLPLPSPAFPCRSLADPYRSLPFPGISQLILAISCRPYHPYAQPAHSHLLRTATFTPYIHIYLPKAPPPILHAPAPRTSPGPPHLSHTPSTSLHSAPTLMARAGTRSGFAASLTMRASTRCYTSTARGLI